MNTSTITIFEGPDGSGKTHLSTCPRFGVHRMAHLSAPKTKDGAFREVLDQLTSADEAADPRQHLGFDRLHLSEQVYGPVYRKGSGITGPQRRMLERVLLSRRAGVVLCLPPYETAVANWRARAGRGGEMFPLDETAYGEVYLRYTELHTDLPVVMHDYTTDLPEETGALLDWKRPPVNRGPGIGCFAEGNVLLVGEQVNLKWDGPYLPFVNAGGASPWLAEQLEQWGVPETSLYWVNALDPQGNRADPKFLDALRPRKVVAMGKIAQDWCQRANVAFHQVPHPQHWKRFHHHVTYPLKEHVV